MKRGYTKRWRKRWDKGYHKDWLLFLLMEYFIDFANWQEREFAYTWQGKLLEMVKVRRGECFFTHSGLADVFTGPKQSVSRKMIASRVAILKKVGFLGHIKGHKYQIVKVLNYDKYNPVEEVEGHTNGRNLAASGPQVGRKVATPNNYKELKELKEGKIYIPKNFKLNEKLKVYALDRNIDSKKVDELFQAFFDYHFNKKTKYVVWDKVWYTWVRNAPDFSKWAMNPPGPKTVSSKTKTNIKILKGVK